MFEQNKEYAAFVAKFEPKKTTDDCYTPALVYDAVADWVSREYCLDRQTFMRPFWPGGDYERAEYPEGCVVVDNPPFSILSSILRFFENERIPYFLFAPALTLFSAPDCDCTYYPCGVSVTYANGAVVPTSFISNLDAMKIRCCPQLYQAVKDANATVQGALEKSLSVYRYPSDVITAALAQKLTSYGVSLDIPKTDAMYINELDQQKRQKKSMFGGGFLLSSRAAADRAAADRAVAELAAANTVVWHLSERERWLQQMLDKRAERRKGEKDHG